MAFSFEPFLAISAGHIMAVSTGPEHGEEKKRIEEICDEKLEAYYNR